jgi:putative membrane protein
VLIADFLLSGVHIKDILTSVLVAFVLAILNNFLKPILIVLTIPITIFTFGFFLLVINALMAMLATKIVPGFFIEGFWWAVGFSLIISFLNYLINIENRKSKTHYN